MRPKASVRLRCALRQVWPGLAWLGLGRGQRRWIPVAEPSSERWLGLALKDS